MDKLDELPQIPATHAKQAFGEMLDRLRSGQPLAITSHGRIKALIATPEMWSTTSEKVASAVEELDRVERKLARALQGQVEHDRFQRHARLAVELLGSAPDRQAEIVNAAKARVQRWKANGVSSDDYIDRWAQLLSLPVQQLARAMVGDCDGWGPALRQNTPFSLRPESTDAGQA
ncbi:MAG: type II toxin-antitoxin system prevent-host-death family antitoxin [Hydrogenophaga sp.]|nr:type II toxin-antitoxin system prevent-host-death family antitoxin [Hydrogenophaga sp.]